jgi:succinate dehydrogenase (ubiquinone) membrane anchor subunit
MGLVKSHALAPASMLLCRRVDASPILNKNFIESLGVRQSSHGSHSGLWTIERGVSAGLLALIPAAFMTNLPGMDYGLALALVAHVHWGVEAIVIDYIRPNIFGAAIPKIALLAVYLLSALSLGGLFYFNYTDVGVANGLRMAWQKL